MTSLLATSVVRGSEQGESHGGVYRVDLDSSVITQLLDWNTVDIDWQGRGWDRGLRGIAFDGDRIFIAASNELFEFSEDFEMLASYRNPYLMHCHEITVYQRRLYLTSTAYDSVLGFDLDNNAFCFGLNIVAVGSGFQGGPFDPLATAGPVAGNLLHLNSIFCDTSGLFLSGLNTRALIRFDGRSLTRRATLPMGVHNARPYGEGVMFNDTDADRVRCVLPKKEVSFSVPQWDEKQLTHIDKGDAQVARASFGRGLCVVNDGLLAAGSSPSTIALHDLNTARTSSQINLSSDVRNAIHGLEVWPYG